MKKILFLTLVVFVIGCARSGSQSVIRGVNMERKSETSEIAVIGGGCFWCIEAVFEQLDGVLNVISGYAGGSVNNPSYEQVSSGKTGHAEVVYIEFEPEKISFMQILDMFWRAHNPTTKNRQGADVGTQYRSVILYTSEEQREAVEESLAHLKNSGYFNNEIVTEVAEFDKFYPAEEYHQDYYAENSTASYCAYVITPKLKKLDLDYK